MIDDAANRFRYEDCRDGILESGNLFAVVGHGRVGAGHARAARDPEPALLGRVLLADRLGRDRHDLSQPGGGGRALHAGGFSPGVRQARPRDHAGARAHRRLQEDRRRAWSTPVRRAAVHLSDAQPLRSHHRCFADSNAIQSLWRRLQIQAFTLLSSGNAFIGSQYFTVRGLRTLNGKLVQHQLSTYYAKHPDRERAPLPSAISYYHFMDESFHFNSSRIVGIDVPRSLPAAHRPSSAGW